MAHPFNVLFPCTGNSARSIMAEAILNKLGAGKFRAYSAGSQPKGKVNPHTRYLLQSLGHDTSGFRSKSWNEFAKPGAPALDFAFTVCDNAAGEVCPVWPGQPMTAHWGVPDPAEAKGSPAEIALAFKDAYRMLHQRIGVFTALPIRSLDQLSLHVTGADGLRQTIGPRHSRSHPGPGETPRDFTNEDLFSSWMMSMHNSTHSSQINTVGPAMSLRTSCWLLPQNEQ